MDADELSVVGLADENWYLGLDEQSNDLNEPGDGEEPDLSPVVSDQDDDQAKSITDLAWLRDVKANHDDFATSQAANLPELIMNAVAVQTLDRAENVELSGIHLDSTDTIEQVLAQTDSLLGYEGQADVVGVGMGLSAVGASLSNAIRLPDIELSQVTDSWLDRAAESMSGLEVKPIEEVTVEHIEDDVRRVEQLAQTSAAAEDTVDRAVQKGTTDVQREVVELIQRQETGQRDLAGGGQSIDAARQAVEASVELGDVLGWGALHVEGAPLIDLKAVEVADLFSGTGADVNLGAFDFMDDPTLLSLVEQEFDPNDAVPDVDPYSSAGQHILSEVLNGEVPVEAVPPEAVNSMAENALALGGNPDISADEIAMDADQEASYRAFEDNLRAVHGFGIDGLARDGDGRPLCSATPHEFPIEIVDDKGQSVEAKWDFWTYVYPTTDEDGNSVMMTMLQGIRRDGESDSASVLTVPVNFGSQAAANASFYFLDNHALANPALGPLTAFDYADRVLPATQGQDGRTVLSQDRITEYSYNYLRIECERQGIETELELQHYAQAVGLDIAPGLEREVANNDPEPQVFEPDLGYNEDDFFDEPVGVTLDADLPDNTMDDITDDYDY